MGKRDFRPRLGEVKRISSYNVSVFSEDKEIRLQDKPSCCSRGFMLLDETQPGEIRSQVKLPPVLVLLVNNPDFGVTGKFACKVACATLSWPVHGNSTLYHCAALRVSPHPMP